MTKFNKTTTAPAVASPITTTAPATTYEGGNGFARDTCSDLVLLAVTNMVGEATFYESAGDRDKRFRDLVHKAAVADPAWMADFVKWLRTGANMRSASVVAAAEAVKARLDGRVKDDDRCMPESFNGAGWNRKIIDAACARADEPGEVLAYWTSRYGRKIPKPVKRGVADAVRRLYTERTFAKYDSDSKGYRFGDVIDLVHPSPADDKPYQGDLFQHALDRRHNRDNPVPESLRVLTNRSALLALPVAQRKPLLMSTGGQTVLADAGMTWESVAGWLQGPMDAKAWEAIIPSMGAMALVRNLRNFDQAGVSDEVAAKVCARLADPEEIRRSRMFPYRMLSAYKVAPSPRWGYALDKALDAACGNLPALDGRTLVLVDTSGSMTGPVSAKSQVTHLEIGALFGVALAMRGNAVDLIGFADGVFPHNIVKGGSVLKQCDEFVKKSGIVGHGTRLVEALQSSFKPGVHTRVVIISDMQMFPYMGWGRGGGLYGRMTANTAVPADVPVFAVNTAGYASTAVDTASGNRFEIGGFSDAMFTMVGLLSRSRDAGWPWENGV